MAALARPVTPCGTASTVSQSSAHWTQRRPRHSEVTNSYSSTPARALRLSTACSAFARQAPPARQQYSRALSQDAPEQRSTACAASGWQAPPARRRKSSIVTWLKSLLAPKSRIFFTDDPELLGDCRELAALWTACLKQPCYSDHQKCEQAIRHSFTVQLAFSEESHEDPEQPVTLTLVAAARTISDGYFAAQLVDVCVREDFRELGIGGQLVDKLSAQTRALGPQTMAVFAGPEHRLFFWKCGFRWDHRYKIMRHVGDEVEASEPPRPSDASDSDLEAVFR